MRKDFKKIELLKFNANRLIFTNINIEALTTFINGTILVFYCLYPN